MNELHRKRRTAVPIVLAATLAAGVAAAFTGCGGGKPAKADAPMLRIDVTAAPNANASSSGEGLPVVVRLYELTAQGGFTGSDFFSIFDREVETLGSDLVAREELTLAPGQRREVSAPLSVRARYLGVLGAFHDIDRAQWRRVVPLASDGDNRVSVFVGADSIRVESL